MGKRIKLLCTSAYPFDIVEILHANTLREMQAQEDKQILDFIASMPSVPVLAAPVSKVNRIRCKIRSMYLKIAKRIHESLDSTRMALGKKILGKLLDRAFYEEYGERDDY